MRVLFSYPIPSILAKSLVGCSVEEGVLALDEHQQKHRDHEDDGWPNQNDLEDIVQQSGHAWSEMNDQA